VQNFGFLEEGDKVKATVQFRDAKWRGPTSAAS